MSIARFLKSNINVGKTCSNCIHRHTKSDFATCIHCQEQATNDKPFPLHEEDNVEEEKP